MITEYTTIDMYDGFILFLVEYFRVIDVDLSEDAIAYEIFTVCSSQQVTPGEHSCMCCNSSTNALSCCVELPVQIILMRITAE